MSALTLEPWVITAGSSASADGFTDLAFYGAGLVLVSGFGTLAGSGSSGSDQHLSLRDERGRLLWQWNSGASGEDAFLAVTSAGSNILAAGFLSSGSGSSSHRNAYVALFDGVGDLKAAQVVSSDTATDDQFNDVVVTPFGQIVLVGVTRGNGTIGGQTKANPAPSGSDRGRGDGLITILANGTTITRLVGSTGDDGLDAVAVVPSGSSAGTIVVAGYQSVGSDQQAYLAAYDGAGTRLWERFLGSGSATDRLTSVVCDGTTIYVAGSTRGVLPGSGSARSAARSDGDAFVAAFDLSGQPLWARQLDASSLDDDTAELALAGNRLELLSGDGADLRRATLSTAGQLQSTGLIASAPAGTELPGAILTDAQGRVVVAGSSNGGWPQRSAGGSLDALLQFSGGGLNIYQLDVQPLEVTGLPRSTSFVLEPVAGQRFVAGSYAGLTGRVVIDAAGAAVYTPYAELPELYGWASTLEDSIPLSLTDLNGTAAASQDLVLRLAAAPATAAEQGFSLLGNRASGIVRSYGLARPELRLRLSDTTYTTSLGSSRALSAFSGTSADVSLRLAVDLAPITTLNALRYARELIYDRTVFHRVIDGFMVQGGGFSADRLTASGFGAATTFEQIPLEGTLSTGLSNLRGTIAMARTSNPNSATGQFFINVADNLFLNDTAASTTDPSGAAGYAVFGAVASGLDVVDGIARAPLRNSPTGGNDSSWGGQDSGALFEDITEPVVVIEQARVQATPAGLQYSVVRDPSNGQLSLDSATGSFTYLPSYTYNGSDSFELRITSPALAGLPERSSIQRIRVSGDLQRFSRQLAASTGGNRFNSSEATSPLVDLTSNGSPDLIEVSTTVALTLQARSSDVWGAGFWARNVGSAGSPGTGERLALQGLARYSFVTQAIDAAVTTIVLEPEKNSAFFLHDAYSAFHADLSLSPDGNQRPSTQRLLNVDTIVMGSDGGTSIVDLTSTDYVTGAITVRGAPRGTSMFWGSDADDSFISGGGDAVICSGGGSNRLELGAGADILQYRAGGGAVDVVQGFNPSRDLLELWVGQDQATATPTVTSTAIGRRLSWAGNSIEFAGLPNLSLDSLQIRYATALA